MSHPCLLSCSVALLCLVGCGPEDSQPTTTQPPVPEAFSIDELPMRMPWQPDSGGFLKQWLILGPIASAAEAEGDPNIKIIQP